MRINERAIQHIERKALDRCQSVARYELEYIKATGPLDTGRRPERHGEPHLRNSYFLTVNRVTNTVTISTRRRYWKYVEFGTTEHGSAQPHIRPARDAARARFR